MKRFKKVLLFTMCCLMLLMAGCVENEESKKEEQILEARETGIVSVRKEEGITIISKGEVCAGEYEIDGVFSENDILIGKDKLKIVIPQKNKTLVLIVKKNGVIKKGEKIFSLKRKENIYLKEKEAVTENELENKNYKKNRAVAENILLGDFNLDGIVDIKDQMLFKEHYGENYETKYDISPAILGTGSWSDIYSSCTPDGQVNILDFIIFGRNYGKVNPDNYGVKLGGDNDTIPSQIIESIENGATYYIVIGTTNSTTINRIPNDNTTAQNNYGKSDIYVAKLDSDRNIIWQNVIGGTGSDTGIGVVTTNTGYVIVGNSSSPIMKGPLKDGILEINVTNKLNFAIGENWVYFAGLDRNGKIIGHAPKISGKQLYVTGLIKNMTNTGYIYIGMRKETVTSSWYGIIEEMDTSFNYTASFVLNQALNSQENNIIVLPNSFYGITTVTEADGSKNYVVVGNMYDNNNKQSILMMKFKNKLVVNNMQINKPYIFFRYFNSQYVTNVIEDTTGINKGGVIICGYGISEGSDYKGLVAKIDKTGNIKETPALDENAYKFNSVALFRDTTTFDWKYLCAGEYIDRKYDYFSVINKTLVEKYKKCSFGGNIYSMIPMSNSNDYMAVSYAPNSVLNCNQIYVYKINSAMKCLY